MKKRKKLLYKFFKPTIWLANRLSMLKIFLLFLGLNFFILSYLSYAYLHKLQIQVEKDNKKIKVLKINKTLFSLMISLQETRGVLNADAQGDKYFDEQLNKAQNRNKKYISQLNTYLNKEWVDPKISKQWNEHKEHLKILSSKKVFSKELFQNFTDKIEHITQLILSLAHSSEAVLDENESNYYNSQLLYRSLPSLIEAHGKLRGIGTAILSQKSLNAQEWKELILHKYDFLLQLKRVQTFLKYSDSKLFSPEERQSLKTPKSIALLNRVLNKDFSISSQEYFKTFTNVSDRYINLYNKIYKQLLEHLIKRKKEHKSDKIIGYFSISILIFLLFYLLTGILLSIQAFIKDFLNATQNVAKGNFNTKVKIKTNSEYKRIVEGLNHMIDELANSAKLIDRYVDISETDLKGTITSVSTAFTRHSGYRREEVIGQNHNILRHPDTPAEYFKKMWIELKQGRTWEGEIKNKRKDGSDFWLSISIIPQYDKNFQPSGYVSIRRDISNQKKIEELSVTDYLTQIYNRKYFNEKLKENITMFKRYKTSFSIIMLDIDHFKKINDSHGHLVGDECLIKLSSLIKKNLRDSDIFARWGGEEFMILLPHIHKDEAIKIGEKLRLLISSHKFEKVSAITISIGVTTYLESDTYDTILDRVDNALYMAKDKGRDCVIFL